MPVCLQFLYHVTDELLVQGVVRFLPEVVKGNSSPLTVKRIHGLDYEWMNGFRSVFKLPDQRIFHMRYNDCE